MSQSHFVRKIFICHFSIIYVLLSGRSKYLVALKYVAKLVRKKFILQLFSFPFSFPPFNKSAKGYELI